MRNEEPKTMAYSPEEAAKVIGLSKAGIYRLLRAGKLRCRKAGHRTLILASELERYLNELPEGTAEYTNWGPPKGVAS